MRARSPVFDDGEEIPRLYTCDGDDIPPPLEWEGVPEGTESLALIVDDPDAPDPRAPKMTWVHWKLADLQDPDKDALLAAMEGRVLATSELIGTYGR